MTEEEKKRYFRYSLRRFQDLSPARLNESLQTLIERLIGESYMDEESFWDLYNDLISHNNWKVEHVLAYFSTYNLEDHT